MSQTQTCQSCGAKILAEHVDQGRAGRWAGQLLCAVCYAEKRGAETPAAAKPAAAPPAPAKAAPPAGEEEPISLVETAEGEAGASRIQTFGQQFAGKARKQFTRAPTQTGRGACRVRTFHSKIQVESIEFMDNAINEWLDDNPDIEVKFVSSTIGVMAGKFPEPNLILNIWY